MGLVKKHRSLVDMLRSALMSTDNSHDSPSSHPEILSTHRSFFRRRESRASITPQSSTTSLRSTGATPLGSEYGSDEESANSANLTAERKHKDKKKKCKPRRTDSHHSLRRFFKILHPKDHLEHLASSPQKPKDDLHVLTLSDVSRVARKYNVGRFIGLGASGSVNLIAALENPDQIFALKKFRTKMPYESDHDYITKVRNEFLVGEYLRHQNLIHTEELIREDLLSGVPEFFLVMEYCPHDFFTLVMSGLMRKDEIFCYFKQIISGTNYLHISGIAHRDLKLDNCVVDNNGILKLIDFGSAFQFRKPLDFAGGTGGEDVVLDEGHKLVFARGIVGSDPYLAPEVLDQVSSVGYDARLADVWSIAIIFCCMVLKRFPWKVPKTLDLSFRAFCERPLDPNQDDYDQLIMKPREHKTGPDRLLHLLPTVSRGLIRAMLTVDSTKRYLMKDVLESDFYKTIDHCHYYEQGETEAPRIAWDSDNRAIVVSTSADGNESSEALTAINSNPSYKPETAPSEETILQGASNAQERGISTTREVTPVRSLPKVGTLIRGKYHRHHLVTEEEVERIHAKKKRAK